MPSERLCRIRLEGLRFFAHHGVLDEERRRGQVFLVDLDLDCRAPAEGRDDLAGTVDYAAVYGAVREVFTGEGPYNLIETLARRVAGEVLDGFPGVRRVVVTVHKPGAPLPGPFGGVSVQMEHTRSDPDGGKGAGR